jgi:nucleotide-binding universal stress UspA family protein
MAGRMGSEFVAVRKWRPRQKEQAMPGIVVGVDGSEHSQPALEWAMKEAAVRHVPLTVLAVHQVAASYWTGSPIVYPADTPEAEKARQSAEETVSQTAGRLGDASPASVTVRAVNGVAARELISASQDADLIVVGRRGGGGFVGLMMGSVSSQVSHHAACPVVVIP